MENISGDVDQTFLFPNDMVEKTCLPSGIDLVLCEPITSFLFIGFDKS